jgi:hypothetical protein
MNTQRLFLALPLLALMVFLINAQAQNKGGQRGRKAAMTKEQVRRTGRPVDAEPLGGEPMDDEGEWPAGVPLPAVSTDITGPPFVFGAFGRAGKVLNGVILKGPDVPAIGMVAGGWYVGDTRVNKFKYTLEIHKYAPKEPGSDQPTAIGGKIITCTIFKYKRDSQNRKKPLVICTKPEDAITKVRNF